MLSEWVMWLPLPEPPAGTAVWWYVTAMCLAVVVIGIAKAGFGGGIGILAVPLVANAVPADRAIGVMLPILIVADVVSIAQHRRAQSWLHLRWLFAGAAVGIVAGTLVLVSLKSAESLRLTLNLLVGSICLAMVAVQCVRLAGGPIPHIPPGPGGGVGTGVLSGVTSTIAHAAGPIASIYLLEQKLDKRLFVGTMLVFFFAVNLAKLPTYFGLGLINTATLLEGLWFLPLVPVGAAMGVWMHRRIPEKPFTAIVYTGAALAAGHLIYKAVV
jgi:uncharacterized membrane protein YfcA